MKKKTSRVVVARNVKGRLDLAKKLYEKHLELGDKSPLLALQDLDWSLIGPTVKTASEHHEAAESFTKKAEMEYKERDRLFEPIDDILKASKNLLKTIHSQNTKRLVDWGFEIDDTPVKKKE